MDPTRRIMDLFSDYVKRQVIFDVDALVLWHFDASYFLFCHCFIILYYFKA